MIVKTGVILKMVGGYPGMLFSRVAPEDTSLDVVDTLYGDLHVIGDCAIVYYPPMQAPHRASHGWLTLNGVEDMFQRASNPHCILVLQAKYVRMRKAALHPLDLSRFELAGGIVDNRPGELG